VKYRHIVIICCGLLPTAQAILGHQAPALQTNNGQYNGGFNAGTENLFVYVAVEVDVKGQNGTPILGPVYVSLIKDNGQVFMTTMAAGGKARFSNVPKSELTAQVVASGYETAKKTFQVLDHNEVKVSVDLQPMSDREAAASDRGISALSPKAQKDIGKALEALRANKMSDARANLDAAQRDAPNSAEVAYLLGVYAAQTNNPAQARSYWMRALELKSAAFECAVGGESELASRTQGSGSDALLRPCRRNGAVFLASAHAVGAGRFARRKVRRRGEGGRAQHRFGPRARGVGATASGTRAV
jgi:hypothetical protein